MQLNTCPTYTKKTSLEDGHVMKYQDSTVQYSTVLVLTMQGGIADGSLIKD